MAAVDIDATLGGGGTLVGGATALYALGGSALAGGGTLVGGATALYALGGSALAGGGTLVGGATALYALGGSALAGGATLTVDAKVLLSAILSSAGAGQVTAVLFLSQGSSVTFAGGATFVNGDLGWTPHPNAPPPKPAVNAAATLQQFIDSTGSGRAATRTPLAGNTVVDPNPPRKPPKPQ